MKHQTTRRFWKYFNGLSEDVKRIAEKNFELLKKNPTHPSLHFKKVGRIWSARVGIRHRALAVKDEEDFIWVWIGTHDEYERMIQKMT
jgi:hypothetical protein